MRKKVKVKVVNKSKLSLPLPQYETSGAAGMDVRADLTSTSGYNLGPGESVSVPTGLYVEIPPGYEIQVRPRSGLAFKHQITVLNSPGTIDSDYRGEIKVILINHSTQYFMIEPGMRIGQLVLNKYEQLDWAEDEDLSNTERGSGGFGSTGT